ncbi:MAG: tyrosine-type recombinase/integrase [Dermatophilaceae bacterium]
MTVADPLAGVRRPQAHSDDVDRLGLDRDQARIVLTAAASYSPRAHALTALLLFTGVRVSEAINADLADLSDVRGHHVLRVIGKGNRPRTVPLPPPVRHAIDEYTRERAEGPMFTTSSGHRWDRTGAHDTITRIGHRAGIPLFPHLLRHTAATLALDAGAPLDRVQDLLGHADPRTTMRYAHARQRLDTSAAYDLARWLADDGH